MNIGYLVQEIPENEQDHSFDTATYFYKENRVPPYVINNPGFNAHKIKYEFIFDKAE